MSDPRWWRSRSTGLLAMLLIASVLIFMSACSGERAAEEAFREVTAGESGRPLEEVKADLEDIRQRWPDSRAAEMATREIEWINEQQLVESRGPALMAWDAVRKVAAAAETFRLKKGRYPKTLGEMVPRYLDGSVKDPWGYRVRYSQTSRGYKVICYGEDGLPGGSELAKDLLIDTGQVVGATPER